MPFRRFSDSSPVPMRIDIWDRFRRSGDRCVNASSIVETHLSALFCTMSSALASDFD